MDNASEAAGQYADAFQRMGESLWDAWGVWANAGAESATQAGGRARYAAAIDVAEKLVCDAQQVQSDCIELWRAVAHPLRPRSEVRHLGDGLDAFSEWAEGLFAVQRRAVRSGFEALRAADHSMAWRKAAEIADPQSAFELWNEFADALIRAMNGSATGAAAPAATGSGQGGRKTVNAGRAGERRKAAASE